MINAVVLQYGRKPLSMKAKKVNFPSEQYSEISLTFQCIIVVLKLMVNFMETTKNRISHLMCMCKTAGGSDPVSVGS